MAAPPQLWKLTYEGIDYEFGPHSLKLSQLRQIKQWYPDLGTWTRFFAGFVTGDPDAVACAVWVCRRNQGEPNVEEPNRMKDFPVWDSFDTIEAAQVVEDPTVSEETSPAPSATTEPKPDSVPTPTNSEDETSSI